ncbi:cysteine desulfurase family protein [Paenibacillus aurantius]|uniref:cysteine desulfurase n=1 Tax=Paenibacillus aurantius TaxID=2918900 RepID=A0AA96RJA1_9BACL|nr:cysteine desulfurase family protein [Paenibacillus aurantius]WNQ13019.1 cysteine desulfurase family protein [Paenibacillus aurantius]
MNPIYLDYAAATPLHPAVLEQMMPYLTHGFGNPSSLHAFGRSAQNAVREARDTIGARLGFPGRQLVFTSGGTESDNLALFGTASLAGSPGHIITSQIEHHAVLHSCRRLEQLGYRVTYLPVSSTGRISIEDVRAAIRPDTILISIMYGNNEVGTLQPIREIGNLAREHGIPFHVDAVQALGVEELDLNKLPVDLMSFSAHKIQGPKGIGALYAAGQTKLSPQLFGGTQERSRRAGTENVAGIVGFAEAVRLAYEDLPAKRDKLNTLRTVMIRELEQTLTKEGFVINGDPDHRLPHILNVSFPGVSSETMLMNLDLAGIAAASGSACTSGSLELSHVLKAMNLPEEVMRSAVRFSFGPGTTEEEVHRAAQETATIVRRIRNT